MSQDEREMLSKEESEVVHQAIELAGRCPSTSSRREVLYNFTSNAVVFAHGDEREVAGILDAVYRGIADALHEREWENWEDAPAAPRAN